MLVLDFVTEKFALIDCPPFAIALGKKRLQPRGAQSSLGSGLGERSSGARFFKFCGLASPRLAS